MDVKKRRAELRQKLLAKLREMNVDYPEKERRSRQINLRITPRTHDEISAASESSGLSITDYLLTLHEAAWTKLRKQKRKTK